MMPLPKVEMSIFETILARRSVRKYKTREVGRDAVRILLEAAVRAPTATHQEPWGFVVIQDKKLLQNLSNRAKPLFVDEIHQKNLQYKGHKMDIFKQPDFNIFYDAGTVILICGKTNAPFFSADCWLAAENLILAATAMGLGTCIIGSALPALNIPEIKAQLGIPADFSVVGPITLGYPDDAITPVLRKNPIVLANFPRSGERLN
jgi:nitroreductase